MRISVLARKKFLSLTVTGILLVSVFVTPLLLSLQYVSATTEGWWNTSWYFRKEITIDHTKVSGVLENFPVLIDVTDSDLTNKAQTDGDDIVFTDSDGLQLSHEIELYNSISGRLVTWVSIPLLSSAADTKLYVYYGNPDASNQQNSSALWDSHSLMVQHLEEGSTTRYDSTINHNDGTAYGGLNKSTIGKIDGADEFDGVDDYVMVADYSSLNPLSAITVELWINLSLTGDFINLVNKGVYNQFYLRLGPQEGRTYWFVRFDDGTSKSVEGHAGWTENTWHHIVATLDTEAQITKVYVDGVEKLVSSFDSGKNITTTTNPVLISDISQRPIDGIIDEVRISSIARSADWIQTSYNNQKNPSTFYTIGSEESYLGANIPPFISNENPSNGATGVYTNPTLSIVAIDTDGDNMTILFRTNMSGTWEDIGIYSNVGNGIYSMVPTNMSNLGTLYYWSVHTTDGESWTNKTYSLTTTTSILEHKWTANGLPRTRFGVLIADVTGNSLEEVIHAGKGLVTVLNGTDGSTILTVSDSGITDWTQPQMADLNRDGIFEIVVPLQKPAGLLVLHGNNGSTYWRRTDLGLETMSSPVICDIDGNGYPTIFFASTDIYQGLNGTGRVTSLSYDGHILHQTFAWRPCAGGLSIADTDGDGEFELYMGDRHMYMGDADYGKGVRSFWAKNLTERWNHPDILCSSHIPMLADVNKDGIMDVIIGHLDGGVVVLNSTDGSAINKTLNLGSDAPVHYQPSVYDVDIDGNLELLMADFYNSHAVVWDLVAAKVDERIPIGTSTYGPQLADVTGDGIMEIIATNYTTILIFDKAYSQIAQVTPPVGRLNYAVVQDIDGDGYNEVVVSATTGYIYAYDTPARRPTPRPRSEVQFYSEYKLGVAEYVQPLGCPEPVISSPSPPNLATNVPVSLSEIYITLTDYQRDLMTYSVTTYPDIGSNSSVNVTNGRHSVSVSNPAPSTTYTWTVSATDGTYWTNKTYTFTTESISLWWNTSWTYRKMINVDHTKVGADLSNFPVLIDIIDNDLANNAQLGGDDIVFTDANNTRLNHEIELYNNSAGHLVAWVKVPLVSSTTDTTLHMYYGNSDAEDQQNSTAVWDSSCILVQHLEEGSETRYDSTAFGNDGTAYGGVSKSTGKVDGADEFGGLYDYVEVADDPSLNPSSAITIELWMNLSLTGDFINLMMKGGYSQFYLRLGPQEGRTYWFVRFDDGTSKSVEGHAGWTENTWHHIVATLDTEAQITKVYVDGVEKLVSSFDSGKNITTTTNPVLISDISQRPIDGIIDEVRISSIARSADWIQTSYNNQKNPSTFITIGSEETIPEAPLVSDPSPSNEATNVPTSLSELAFNLTDYQGDLMNYTVVTSPNIGSDSGVNVLNGRYTVPVGNLTRSTTYTWTVSVTDGARWTNKTYTFTACPSEIPTQDDPILMLNGGDLACYNQTTYDPDADKVTNVYNWYRNNVSITNLLLPFDASNSTFVKDYSSYGHNGLAVRGVTWTSEGIIGGAYRFDRGYIQILGTSTLDGGGKWSEITVEHWIYLTADQSGTRTIARIPSYEIAISSTNRVVACVWTDNGVWNTSRFHKLVYNTPLQKNKWYHVAFSYKNGTGLTLYINGVAVATNTGVSGNIQTSGAEPLYIGWFDYFEGIIDEVRIYPKSLSPEQIYQRYIETKDGLSNSSTIASQETEIGDTWKCEITPNDGYQDGIAKFSNSITIGFSDIFNDNSTNLAIWKKLEKNNGTVSEINGRVECSVETAPPSGTAGYITIKSYDLSNCDIRIDVSNQYLCEAALVITLDGINDHFWYSENFYSIQKHRWDETCNVKKRIDGGDHIYLYNESWTGPTGSLRIRIHEGIIYFYEEDDLVYFEEFDLSSYNCYIHFEANTWGEGYFGTDYFDNFMLLLGPP